MKFIIGAAYQGMEEYAAENCGVQIVSAADETEATPDFSTGCVNGLDRFVLGCVRRGESPVERFAACEEAWKDCVLIGRDMSCGLVPMEAENRLWREENGRLNNYLAGKADTVIRMFCGIPQVLK